MSSGDVLWFIHADCQVPADALELLRQALVDPGVVGGGLQASFDQRSVGLEYLAASSNVRARRRSLIFGDLGVDPERIRRRYEDGTRRGRRSR